MAVFNARKREIECKLVYYGPGRCGKTTNLESIGKTYRKHAEGELVSIDTEGDRTLFFDFLPMGLGKIKGCEVRIQLYTVPGQVKYASTRKLVLKGVDGVVFVADSMEVRREKNMLSLKDLQQNLKDYGMNIFKIPLIMQYNKRDLGKEGIPIMSVKQMEHDLNRQLKAPSFKASALSGEGVGPTLKAALEETLKYLHREMHWAG
jgi:signal recognition particle receptor subunit beta